MRLRQFCKGTARSASYACRRVGILITVVMVLLPNASCSRTPVEFDSLTLTIEPPMDILPGFRNAWIHGHVLNRGNSFITNVIVKPEVVSRSGKVTSIESTLVLSVYLEPGQSMYFHSGGFMLPEAAIGQGAVPRLRFGYIDWIMQKNFGSDRSCSEESSPFPIFASKPTRMALPCRATSRMKPRQTLTRSLEQWPFWMPVGS